MLHSLAQLRVRVLRPGRADHDRQAAAGAVAAGGERQAVRLLAAQPAVARGDRAVSPVAAALPRASRAASDGGRAAASALALAVFPSFVAVSRENGVDPLLILLMILACGPALAAIESGPLATLAVLRRARSGWRSTRRRSPPSWSSPGSRSATRCAHRGPTFAAEACCLLAAGCRRSLVGLVLVDRLRG